MAQLASVGLNRLPEQYSFSAIAKGNKSNKKRDRSIIMKRSTRRTLPFISLLLIKIFPNQGLVYIQGLFKSIKKKEGLSKLYDLINPFIILLCSS